ncbi:MAG: 7 8-dihydro-8-oxoguanine triphosphatase, partial [Halothiobacillaceae bacterium]
PGKITPLYRFFNALFGLLMSRSLTLPSRYQITPDPAAVGEDYFWRALQQGLRQGVELVQIRSKGLTASAYQNIAVESIEYCHRHGARVVVNGSPALAQAVGADGVHLTAHALMTQTARPLPSPLLVAASCHNEAELRHAAHLNADFAVLSPILHTASHPEAIPLGWSRYAEMIRGVGLPVYALGGMTLDDQERAVGCGGQGVAGIGMFVQS